MTFDGALPNTRFTQTQDNIQIAYTYFPIEKSQGVVLLVHGYDNPGGKTQMYGHVGYLHQLGYSVAALDLRAFGESSGQKTTLGITEWQDVVTVFDELKKLPENGNKPIGFLGVSMGAVTSLITASETQKGDFVIAAVPYASLDSLLYSQLIARKYPAPLFFPFVRLASYLELGTREDRYSAEQAVTKISVPLLIIGATQDRVVPPGDADTIYARATSHTKTLVHIESNHDTFYYKPDEFKHAVKVFLEAVQK